MSRITYYFTKTPVLVSIVLLLAVGITSAYGIVNITFAGDVIATGTLNVDGTLSSPTITNLQSQISSIDSRISVLEGP